MGISSKKSKTKTSSTTTPTVTEPYNTSFKNFAGKIDNFLALDPRQFVAPTSALQQQAFDQAQNLGGWKNYLEQAEGLARQAGDAAASQITPHGYKAAKVPKAALAGRTRLGKAARAKSAKLGKAATFGGAKLGNAATMKAAKLGRAPTVKLGGYRLPNLGKAAQIGTFNYDAPELGEAALVNADGLLGDPKRLREYMDDYQNPYTERVVDAALDDFDETAGQQRAAMAANAARNKAFPGSRYGIAEAQLEGELARGRASTEAALLDQQYRLAAQLAGVDAGAANQFGLARADLGMNARLANQQAENMFDLEQAGLAERAGQFNANMGFQSASANMDANNQFALTRYGAGIDQARFGAEARNQGALANQGARMQYGLTGAGLRQDAAGRNMDARNNFRLQGGAFRQQAGLENMGARNQFATQRALLGQQTNLANMDAANNFRLQQGQMDQRRGEFNASTQNDFTKMRVGLDTDAARYYADAQNQAAINNANLQEQMYNRQLASAGMLGNLGQQYGAQQLADVGMTAGLGSMQRDIDKEFHNAVPTQLQMAGQLYQTLYPGMYVGQNSNSVSKTKEGGPGTWLPQLAGSAMQAGAMAFSDRRLKSNIERVGELEDGLGMYDYDIGGKRERGVMADEVEQLRPWALGPVIGGYRTVDYSRLGDVNNA